MSNLIIQGCLLNRNILFYLYRHFDISSQISRIIANELCTAGSCIRTQLLYCSRNRTDRLSLQTRNCIICIDQTISIPHIGCFLIFPICQRLCSLRDHIFDFPDRKSRSSLFQKCNYTSHMRCCHTCTIPAYIISCCIHTSDLYARCYNLRFNNFSCLIKRRRSHQGKLSKILISVHSTYRKYIQKISRVCDRSRCRISRRLVSGSKYRNDSFFDPCFCDLRKPVIVIIVSPPGVIDNVRLLLQHPLCCFQKIRDFSAFIIQSPRTDIFGPGRYTDLVQVVAFTSADRSGYMRSMIVDRRCLRFREIVYKILIVAVIDLSRRFIITFKRLLNCRKIVINTGIDDSYGNAFSIDMEIVPHFIRVDHGYSPFNVLFIRFKN